MDGLKIDFPHLRFERRLYGFSKECSLRRGVCLLCEEVKIIFDIFGPLLFHELAFNSSLNYFSNKFIFFTLWKIIYLSK